MSPANLQGAGSARLREATEPAAPPPARPELPRRPQRRIGVRVRAPDCRFLFIALLVLLVSYPFLLGTLVGTALLSSLGLGVLLLASFATRQSFGRVTLILAIALVVFGLEILDITRASSRIHLMHSLAYCLFYAFVALLLFRYVIRDGPVTTDRIFAAAVVYIMIGLVWGALYTILYELQPTAFLAADFGQGAAKLDYFDFLYVSFGTLTSAGYEGITPITRQARSLTILEEVIGVFFTAIIIARLAGIYRPDG